MKRGLNKLGQEFCNQRLLTVRSRQLKLTLCDCHLNLGQTPSKTTGLFQDLTQQRGYGTTAVANNRMGMPLLVTMGPM